MSVRDYVFRLRTESGLKTMTIPGDKTIGDLLDNLKSLLNVTNPSDQIKVKLAHPTKFVDEFDKSLKIMDIKDISPRDTFDIQVVPSDSKPFQGKQRISPKNYSKIPQKPPGPYLAKPVGNVVRRVVPSDNSCLFHAISYCLEGQKSRSRCVEYAQNLRKVIADTVSNVPELYTSAFLGQEPKDYQKFILQKDSWGGGIELSILSYFYQIEICAISNGKAIRFGEEEGYDSMIMLAYNGNHYDALVVSKTGDERDDITVFSPKCEDLLSEACILTLGTYSAANFQGMVLKCETCHTICVGEQEIQNHTSTTGHVNFDVLKD